MDPGEDPRPGTEKSQQETGNTPAAIGWRRQKSCRDRKNKRGMVARKRCFCGVRDELMSQPDHEWAGMKPSRSEEHTSELQSLMRISYAVLCLKQKKQTS